MSLKYHDLQRKETAILVHKALRPPLAVINYKCKLLSSFLLISVISVMHNTDLITGGVGFVSGELDTKHTFIICNLSLRRGWEEKKWNKSWEETESLRRETRDEWNRDQPESVRAHVNHHVLKDIPSLHMWNLSSTTFRQKGDKGESEEEKRDLFSWEQTSDVFLFQSALSPWTPFSRCFFPVKASAFVRDLLKDNLHVFVW